MWNPFKKVQAPLPLPEPVEEVSPKVAETLPPVTLARMKWVMLDGQVGIITGLDSSGYASIALVNAEGITMTNVRAPNSSLRVALFSEIPVSRRPADPVYAATLGYF